MIAVGGSFNCYRTIIAYKFLTWFFLVVSDFYNIHYPFWDEKTL